MCSQQKMTRQVGAGTSIAAAEQVRPHLDRLQQTVLDAIRRHKQTTGDGLTDEELEALAEFQHFRPSTARKRRTELVALGYVRSTGETRNRMQIWEPIPDRELEQQKLF